MKKLTALLTVIMLTVCSATVYAGEEKPLEGKNLTVAMSPDFMYFETVSETEECGYEGLDIDAITRDGRTVPIFRRGKWAF